jgi:hypothetical protein
VFIDSGTAALRLGAAVEVTGTVRTFLGARESGALPALDELPPLSLETLSRLPLVVATSVSTPGGVELIEPPRR